MCWFDLFLSLLWGNNPSEDGFVCLFLLYFYVLSACQSTRPLEENFLVRAPCRCCGLPRGGLALPQMLILCTLLNMLTTFWASLFYMVGSDWLSRSLTTFLLALSQGWRGINCNHGWKRDGTEKRCWLPWVYFMDRDEWFVLVRETKEGRGRNN